MTLPPQSLDDNSKFIIAGAINLYIESRRRLDARVLITVEDIDPLLGICEELMTKRPWSKAKLPEAREHKLSEEEQDAVQMVTEIVTEKVERRA